MGDTLVVALASTLALSSAGLMPSALALASAGGAATLPSADAAAKDDTKLWRDIARGKSSLADMYTYVCYGKVYRFEESENMDNL